MLGPDRSRASLTPHAPSDRAFALGLAFLSFVSVAALHAPVALAQARTRALDLPLYQPELGQSAVPAYRPHKIILELDANTPRPGFGRVLASDAAPQRLASSGLAGVDALNAAYGVTVYEPLFPTETAPVPGSPDEDLTRFYVVELAPGMSLEQALADYGAAAGVKGA